MGVGIIGVEASYLPILTPSSNHSKPLHPTDTLLGPSRGEKLYLTKDKRDSKSRNKCLCWGLCLALVAAALIVGILAAGKLSYRKLSSDFFGSFFMPIFL